MPVPSSSPKPLEWKGQASLSLWCGLPASLLPSPRKDLTVHSYKAIVADELSETLLYGEKNYTSV